MAERGLRHVDIDDPRSLRTTTRANASATSCCARCGSTSSIGLIRADLLGRTGLLRLFHGSCQVLLAELALLGTIEQLPDELMFMRYPTFKILDAKRDMALKMDPEWSGRVFFPEVKVVTEWLRVVRPIRARARRKAALCRQRGPEGRSSGQPRQARASRPEQLPRHQPLAAPPLHAETAVITSPPRGGRP